jgi:hypothetical protein
MKNVAEAMLPARKRTNPATTNMRQNPNAQAWRRKIRRCR